MAEPTRSYVKHGDTRRIGRKVITTPEYAAWHSMLSRCTNPNVKKYPLYGGLGIRVCDEWSHDYAAFLEHIGRRPGPEYSLDRINPFGNYEPGNVRWATLSTQNRNRRAVPRRDVTTGQFLKGSVLCPSS